LFRIKKKKEWWIKQFYLKIIINAWRGHHIKIIITNPIISGKRNLEALDGCLSILFTKIDLSCAIHNEVLEKVFQLLLTLGLVMDV